MLTSTLPLTLCVGYSNRGSSGRPFGAAACQSLPAGVCCEIFYFIVEESDTRIKGNIETLKCIFQYFECKHKHQDLSLRYMNINTNR